MTPRRRSAAARADAPRKVVLGIGNPGPEYDATRHNVGWWVVDRVAFDGGFPAFERRRARLETTGLVGGRALRLLKPLAYVNRSGAALAALGPLDGFSPSRDLLVVGDDANLDVGRIRIRKRGGTGGHRGLESIARTLGTDRWARLRVGVGIPPPGVVRSDWVLAAMPPADEDVVAELLPTLSEAVAVWAEEGVEAAMNRFNR